jgi:hypothetical protein
LYSSSAFFSWAAAEGAENRFKASVTVNVAATIPANKNHPLRFFMIFPLLKTLLISEKDILACYYISSPKINLNANSMTQTDFFMTYADS